MINILEIITGHTGVDHVTSADDASLYRSIFGAEDVVLNVGSQFEHTIISNNLIKIADGDLVIQGHQARIRTNDYEELVIDNGTPGMQRHDLIVARYEKDVVSGIESVKLEVVKGVAGTTAVDPEITQDDITSGGTLREFPLYRVKLNGINIEAVEKMFKLLNLMDSVIVEEGSNNDGEYIKFGNGKMLQIVRYQSKDITFRTSQDFGGVYRTASPVNVTYPLPFIDLRNIALLDFEIGSLGYDAIKLPQYKGTATNSPDIHIATTNSASATIVLRCIAIGYWK